MKGIVILICSILSISLQNRVMEITTNNIQLVLKSYSSLHLLLHNPECSFSKQYSQSYLSIERQDVKMGMIDCLRHFQLCSHLNVSRFPTVGVITVDEFKIIDEQLFLQNYGASKDPQHSEKQMLNTIVRLLKQEPKYVIVVLEEEGLRPVDVVQNQDRLVYVPAPSKLHDTLNDFVGKRGGCWIFQSKTQQTLLKYTCGTGYKANELSKYIQNYKNNKLSAYVISDHNSDTTLKVMDSDSLKQSIIKMKQRYDICRLVYFRAKSCVHCVDRDIQTIKQILNQNQLSTKIAFGIFDVQREQFPEGFHLRRVPELVSLCQGQRNDFGEIFSKTKLETFIKGSLNSEHKIQSKTNSKSQL